MEYEKYRHTKIFIEFEMEIEMWKWLMYIHENWTINAIEISITWYRTKTKLICVSVSCFTNEFENYNGKSLRVVGILDWHIGVLEITHENESL